MDDLLGPLEGTAGVTGSLKRQVKQEEKGVVEGVAEDRIPKTHGDACVAVEVAF